MSAPIEKPKVLYLYGSSTTGKSTLAEGLAKKLEWPLVTRFCSSVSYGLKLVREHKIELDQKDLEIYEALQNFFLYENDIEAEQRLLSNYNFVVPIRDKILPHYKRDERDKHFCERVLTFLQKGSNLIIVDIIPDDFLTHLISLSKYSFDLRKVLLYCPPTIVYQRLNLRNQTKFNQRNKFRPMESFLMLYTTESENEVVDEFDENKLLQFFEENLEYFTVPSAIFKNQNDVRVFVKARFIPCQGVLKIRPVVQPNRIVRSMQGESKENVKEIINYLH